MQILIALFFIVVVLVGPTAVMIALGWNFGRSGPSTTSLSLLRALAISIPLCWSFCDPGTLGYGMGPSWLVAILVLLKSQNYLLLFYVVPGVVIPVLTYVVAAGLGRRRRGKAGTSPSNAR